jgi:metal-dependent amidase/aminoacylase/carboxypeptidase family protein
VTALADLYRDLHRNPELSFAETRTAGIGAAWLREAGFETTEGVGGTGVVGVLRGPGPTALLRADMDALPVAEATCGVPEVGSGSLTSGDRWSDMIPACRSGCSI